VARRLLAEAGFPGGRGFPGFTLTYNTSEGHRQIAEAVQAMWKDVLGIDVRLESQEWQVFLKNLQQGDYDVARLGWAGDYPDPYTFLEVLAPASANNHSGWRDAEYGRLLEQGNAQNDPAERLRLFGLAERRVQEAQPILPVYLYSRAHLVKPYVRGLHLNPQKSHPWRDIWIDPRHLRPRPR
jgi:ABC-type oligopeptide transport system substrate-binding subunit